MFIIRIITFSKIGREDLTLGGDFDDYSLLDCDAVCYYCALFNDARCNSNHTASNNWKIVNDEPITVAAQSNA
jgi:hypothetical protein